MIVIAIGFIPLSLLSNCLDNGCVGKQPVALKEYCAEYWLKELKESMDRCTGYHDITETLCNQSTKTIQATKLGFGL